jgi:hypothetical protein
MYLSLSDARTATKYTDWFALLLAGQDTTFPVVVDGEAVFAKVVETIDKEDYDNDRELSVVVEIDGQFFRKVGWGYNESHCYGNSEPSWGELTQVRAKETKVTLYEEI